MAGYDWDRGKSNNAVIAEMDGLVVKSRITNGWLATNGIDEKAAFVKWLIKMGRISFSEWHHTSKFFNETPYYDASDIQDQLERLRDMNLLDGYHRMYADKNLRERLDRYEVSLLVQLLRDLEKKGLKVSIENIEN